MTSTASGFVEAIWPGFQDKQLGSWRTITNQPVETGRGVVLSQAAEQIVLESWILGRRSAWCRSWVGVEAPAKRQQCYAGKENREYRDVLATHMMVIVMRRAANMPSTRSKWRIDARGEMASRHLLETMSGGTSSSLASVVDRFRGAAIAEAQRRHRQQMWLW